MDKLLAGDIGDSHVGHVDLIRAPRRFALGEAGSKPAPKEGQVVAEMIAVRCRQVASEVPPLGLVFRLWAEIVRKHKRARLSHTGKAGNGRAIHRIYDTGAVERCTARTGTQQDKQDELWDDMAHVGSNLGSARMLLSIIPTFAPLRIGAMLLALCGVARVRSRLPLDNCHIFY